MAQAILTSGGISLVRDWLAGLNPTPPSYIALSSGTLPSPPSPGSFWTRLPAETLRTTVVSADTIGQSVVYHAFLDVNDNSFPTPNTVCYYGLFGGLPSLSLNTGTLIAVMQEPTPFSKDAKTTQSIDVVLTVSGTVG